MDSVSQTVENLKWMIYGREDNQTRVVIYNPAARRRQNEKAAWKELNLEALRDRYLGRRAQFDFSCKRTNHGENPRTEVLTDNSAPRFL